MATKVAVGPGDSISSIAAAHGVSPQAVWNDAGNAALRDLRKDPNILFPGDSVVIPDKTSKQSGAPTGRSSVFRVKGTSTWLRLRFLDGEKPGAGLDYTLEVEGETLEGTTDPNGVLEHRVPPSAKEGKLTIAGRTLTVKIGYLDPIDTDSGVRARLGNLRLLEKDADAEMLRAALERMQQAEGLPVTGEADDATRHKLEQLHGS